MKVIVVAETYLQFKEYVKEALKHDRNISCVLGVVILEEVRYFFVNNEIRMRGHLFTSKDRLVRVGSWYKLPKEDLDAIESSFKARRFKVKK